MSYKHGKAKEMCSIGYKKYGTRKSNKACMDKIYPRQKGWYYQTESSRSRRRKFLRKYSNRVFRRTKEVSSGGSYKKVFDLPWTLD